MTAAPRRDAVTGAFGYTGRAIAGRLLAAGRDVVTLTNDRPTPTDPLHDRVTPVPLDFARPDRLEAALGGVDTLFATYWIRFPRGEVGHERAVAENLVLFAAARAAGVRRIVHVSITGADPASPLPYFRGKGRLEVALRNGPVGHAIVRPTVLFGGRDVLVNNIAWLLRHSPVFGVAGDGQYPIQPVALDDVARLCVEAGEGDAAVELDAVGPETFAFDDVVRLVRRAVGSRSIVVRLPSPAVLAAGAVIGRAIGDVVLTRDELRGLMAGLLVSPAAPTGEVRFSDWLAGHAATLGRRYANELARNYR